jgi:hypothetical protein
MIKKIKKTTKNNLSSFNSEENKLSIQLSLDGFSFCIYNTVSNKIEVLGSYEFVSKKNTPEKHLELVKEVFVEEPILKNSFKEVQVVHFNNLVAQVPQPFFDKENLPVYLNYTVKVLENDYITFDEVSNANLNNVYIPFVNINNFLLDQYGAFTFKHSSTVLIEKLLATYKNTDNSYVFINVMQQQFEIVVLINGKFQLYNFFNFSTKEDFIYYILFVAEQLNLNPEEFKIILMGDIEKESQLYDILYQYVRHISFFNPNSFPEIIANTSKHTYFTLLNIIPCE